MPAGCLAGGAGAVVGKGMREAILRWCRFVRWYDPLSVCAGRQALFEHFDGTIRTQDVRSHDIDQVQRLRCCKLTRCALHRGAWHRSAARPLRFLSRVPAQMWSSPTADESKLPRFAGLAVKRFRPFRCATVQVEMPLSFRPADIVLAEVISLGDARSY